MLLSERDFNDVGCSDQLRLLTDGVGTGESVTDALIARDTIDEGLWEPESEAPFKETVTVGVRRSRVAVGVLTFDQVATTVCVSVTFTDSEYSVIVTVSDAVRDGESVCDRTSLNETDFGSVSVSEVVMVDDMDTLSYRVGDLDVDAVCMNVRRVGAIVHVTDDDFKGDANDRVLLLCAVGEGVRDKEYVTERISVSVTRDTDNVRD